MLTTTQVLFVTLLALYKYGILSASAAEDHYYKLMYNLPEDKRGYVFDKEKRPRYDFGIGKRSLDSNRHKMYAFGLGKRNPLVSNDYDRFLEDLMPASDISSDFNTQQEIQEKEKHRQYDFRIGKRDSGHKMYAFGLGKRSFEDYDIYDFEPKDDYRKRLQPYGFGLGKRAAPQSYADEYPLSRRNERYNFGLGKRSLNDDDGIDEGQYRRFLNAKKSRYNFGLGKRNAEPEGFGYIVPSNQHDLETRANQKFNFGLGKREVRDDYNKRLQPNGFGLGKRAATQPGQKPYGFGIGKRGIINAATTPRLRPPGRGKRNADPEGFGHVVPANHYDLDPKFNFDLGEGKHNGFGLEKRGAATTKNSYTYEYPYSGRDERYNIGIGKRSLSDDDSIDEAQYQRFLEAKKSRYNFGQSKRHADPERLEPIVPFNLHDLTDQSNFGLGKRESRDDYNKRLKPNGFGLEKRNVATTKNSYTYEYPYSGRDERYNFGLRKGKRSLKDDGTIDEAQYQRFLEAKKSRYNFGQSKRHADPERLGYIVPSNQHEQSNFGLGKREHNGFGLEKRNVATTKNSYTYEYPYSGRDERYNFGLRKGKRSLKDDGTIDEAQYQRFLEAKKSRYNFGQSKRHADPEGLGYIVPSNQHDLGKRESRDDYNKRLQHNGLGLEKRNVATTKNSYTYEYPYSGRDERYNFGLRKGKRSLKDTIDEAQYQRFLEAKKSRYNFGQSKRHADPERLGYIVPSNQHEQSNFGLGKRESRDDHNKRLQHNGFGLEKRNVATTKNSYTYEYPYSGRDERYNFGLRKGKRSLKDDGSIDEAQYQRFLEAKKSRYNFGQSKRHADPERLGYIVPSNQHEQSNFGLGKRESRDDYNKRLQPNGFGLEKRAAATPFTYKYPYSGRDKRYNVGLRKGKRSLKDDGSIDEAQYQRFLDAKKSRYSFGQSKRHADPEGSGYIVPSNLHDLDEQSNFGLGKREPRDDHNKRLQPNGFGLEKRAVTPPAQSYTYEYPYSGRDERYNIGIGKRSLSDDNNIDEDQYRSILNALRSRYNFFGLSKRNAEPEGFGLDVPSNLDKKFNFGLGKREPRDDHNKRLQPNGFGLEKRAVTPPAQSYTYEYPYSGRDERYNIGIGKRSLSDDNNIDEDQYRSILNALRSRYNFLGLSKRNAEPEGFGLDVPSNLGKKFNFGLGKREPRDDYNKRLQPNGFGLEKRAATPPAQSYTYEYPYSGRDERYNIGIGKRSLSDDNNIDEDQYRRMLNAVRSGYTWFPDRKRNAEPEGFGLDVPSNLDKKFNFGLGKREVSKEELQQLDDNSPMAAAMAPGLQRLSPLEETDSLLEHQPHSSKTK